MPMSFHLLVKNLATNNFQLDTSPASLPVGGHHPTLGGVAGVKKLKTDAA